MNDENSLARLTIRRADAVKESGFHFRRGVRTGARHRREYGDFFGRQWQTFARRFFPGADPAQHALGKRISLGSADRPPWQIVGVARDGKYFSIGEAPRLFAYLPLGQDYISRSTLLVHTSADPRAMIAPIREEMRRLDANLPVFEVKTLIEHMGLSLFPARVAASLLGGFGLLALALAGVGIYGVMARGVAQRTREIGIRVALGARPGDVLRLVLRRGVMVTAIGVVIGLAASLALTRVMSNLLYGVSATDPLTFVVVTALLAVVALVACLIPAWRATKVDPMIALRHE